MTMGGRDGYESAAARSYPRHRKALLLVATIAPRFRRSIMRPCHISFATLMALFNLIHYRHLRVHAILNEVRYLMNPCVFDAAKTEQMNRRVTSGCSTPMPIRAVL